MIIGVFLVKNKIMTQFKGIFQQSGILSKLLILIGCTSFFTLAVMAAWMMFTNGVIGDNDTLKLFQLVQSIAMFILPPLILAYLWSDKPLSYLHLNKKIDPNQAGFILLFIILAIPFINLLTKFNGQLVLPDSFSGLEKWMKASEVQALQLTEQMLNVHHFSGLLFNILLIAIIPALGEELFFRGAIQRIFHEWKGVKTAIWVTAFIFSAIHLQFYGFLPRLLLGAFFGYLLYWSGSLWLPILAHFANNLIAVIFYYLKNNGYPLLDIDTIGTGNTIWMGFASGVLVVVGIFIIKKQILIKKSRNSLNELS